MNLAVIHVNLCMLVLGSGETAIGCVPPSVPWLSLSSSFRDLVLLAVHAVLVIHNHTTIGLLGHLFAHGLP